jgi:Lactonase, 7-bladed beta-propeller
MSGTMRWRRACAVGMLGVLFGLAIAARPADAAQGDPYLNGCFTAAATAPCVANTKGSRPGAAILSPDDRFLYAPANASGGNGAGVIVYARNATTGALSFSSCVTSNGNGGQCATAANGAGFPWNAAMDRTGQNVYVATESNLQVFRRNPTTGALTFVQCHGSGAGCTPVRGTAFIYSVVVSPDGTSVYARGGGALLVFTRVANGTLTQKAGDLGCLTETAVATCKDVIGLGSNGFQLAVSPEGKYVYVPIQDPGGVSTFERFSDGHLLQRNGTDGGCITRDGSSSGVAGVCADGNDAMVNGLAVTMDPTGRSLYLGSTNGVFGFTRDKETGLLTAGNCITEAPVIGCADGRGVGQFARNLQITRDGTELIVSALGFGSFNGPSSIAFLKRSTATGALTQRAGQRGCIHTNGLGGECLTLPLGGTGATAVPANGLNVYATSVEFGLVARIARDFAPTCQSTSIAVRKNVAKAVPLPCSDVNHDAITLQKVSNPAAGTLGEINQATDSVFYNPFLNFTGRDSFRFRAVARGIASAPATVVIDVPKPRRPKPKPVRVDVGFSYLAFSNRTVLSKLQVKRVPRGARVRATCRVRGHKCSGKAAKAFLKKRARGTVSLAKRFVGVDLPIGARITIVVTKPRAVGAVKILTMRPRKAPKVTTRCLPAGGKKPRKRC